MSIKKLESLAWAARRLHGLSEEEEAGTFVLYVVQNIHVTGEKRMHPIVRVSIKGNGTRRKAKTRFRKECDKAIEYMMQVKSTPREKKLDSPMPLEWERQSDQQKVEQYVKDFIPKAKGIASTELRQMWIKATPAGLFFVDAICSKNLVDYQQIGNTLCIIQGDAKQMAVLSQHMRSSLGFDKGVSIIKEVEVSPVIDAQSLKELIEYLDGSKTYRVTQVGRWAMIQEKRTRKVSPIFGADHFGSLEWMDSMLTAKKAEQCMTAAVESVSENAIITVDMTDAYLMSYGMYFHAVTPSTRHKRSA